MAIDMHTIFKQSVMVNEIIPILYNYVKSLKLFSIDLINAQVFV